MKIVQTFVSFVLLFSSLLVFAQKAQLKMDDITADQDTSITIKKGSTATRTEPDYEIVSGTEEITGDEEIDDKRALASWKESCETWKRETRELNTENKIIILSCGSKKRVRTENKNIYTSVGKYQIRVRIRDPRS